MNRQLEDLIQLLNLENLEHNLFRGESPNPGPPNVFGGQALRPAPVAASRTPANPVPASAAAPLCPFVNGAYMKRSGGRN